MTSKQDKFNITNHHHVSSCSVEMGCLLSIASLIYRQDSAPQKAQYWEQCLHSSNGPFILKTKGQRRVIGSSNSRGGRSCWGRRWREVSVVVDAATAWNYLPTAVLSGEGGPWPSVFWSQPERGIQRRRKHRERNVYILLRLSYFYLTISSLLS